MDYSLFRFEAVVDFVEIEIHTIARNQGWDIKRQCALFGVSYVTPVRADAAKWASSFTIRLYDPKNFAALQSKIASIGSVFPYAQPPSITMIEVAFDGYLKAVTNNATSGDLATLAARMAYRIANPVSTNSRIYRDGKGSPTAMPRALHVTARKMIEGWNVGIGDKTADQYQHGYLKTTDHTDKPIPVKDHRARFEIRLAGAGLPHTDAESWQSFKFETLARYISFRKEDETAAPFQQIIIAGYADRASHPKTIHNRAEGRTRTSRIMPADTELNRIVRKQLQRLTLRWS